MIYFSEYHIYYYVAKHKPQLNSPKEKVTGEKKNCWCHCLIKILLKE